MIDRATIILWKRIGNIAQDISSLSESQVGLDKLKEESEQISITIGVISIVEIDRLRDEKGIVVSEYSNILKGLFDEYEIDTGKIKNCADAIVEIISDMKCGSLKADEYYKKIVSEGKPKENAPKMMILHKKE